MPEVQPAMTGHGGSINRTMTMGSAHDRAGAPDLGQGVGQMLSSRELANRQHYVTPSTPADPENRNATDEGRRLAAAGVPSYYNNYSGLPVPYAAPSALKEKMMMRSAIREAAGKENRDDSGVVRTDPITDEEVTYLKSMRDQAELAKFDEYVEKFIDPRQPGNMRFLMEVYPDYVERRLQQAHTDHEFALRNELIDCWGINTFDDLHFKYLVDQGKVQGPTLQRQGNANANANYTPGWLSFYNFQTNKEAGNNLRLPFASAKTGRRPAGNDPNRWNVSREGQPLGTGNNLQDLAHGMYGQPGRERSTRPIFRAGNLGGFNAQTGLPQPFQSPPGAPPGA